jgi:anaerobic ribonucleoside-triphosphate reductase activating protein
MDTRQVNLAHWATDVTTLGPGRRSAIWVQGCRRHCPHCISPEWQSEMPAEMIGIPQLAERLTAEADTTGLTVSGGEPMLQAQTLVALWEMLRTARPDWTLILFSGFFREEILAERDPGRTALLGATDLFVGGPYQEERNDGRGLRGSSNQELFFREPSRFSPAERLALETGPRQIEVRINGSQVFLIGIPPQGGADLRDGILAPPAGEPKLRLP